MYGSNEQGFDPSDVRLKKRKVEGAENWGVCCARCSGKEIHCAFLQRTIPTWNPCGSQYCTECKATE